MILLSTLCRVGASIGFSLLFVGLGGTGTATLEKRPLQRVEGCPPTQPNTFCALSREPVGIGAMGMSPDGKLLAVANDNAAIELWDLTTWVQVKTLVGHTIGINAVTFSPDGTLLASGGRDNLIKVWMVATGEQLLSWASHSISAVFGLDFSPDGKLLASSGCAKGNGTFLCNPGLIELWEIPGGALVHALKGHTETVWPVAFSPDGKILASGSFGFNNPPIFLWDVATGEVLRTLEGHRRNVNTLVFTQDGAKLASSGDTTIRIWDVQGGRELSKLQVSTCCPADFVALSPDQKLWATSTCGRVITLPDGHNIACVESQTQLWDVASSNLLGILTVENATGTGNGVFTPGGKLLLVTHGNEVWAIHVGDLPN